MELEQLKANYFYKLESENKSKQATKERIRIIKTYITEEYFKEFTLSEYISFIKKLQQCNYSLGHFIKIKKCINKFIKTYFPLLYNQIRTELIISNQYIYLKQKDTI